MEKEVKILAIESSCDETSAAVVVNGREVLSNVIYSQIDIHTLYGGVVPEIASRKHIEKITQVIRQALKEADCTLDDIDAVAVTYGPGLVGALLVGVGAAKAIAFAKNIPLVGVHHIEGHIAANYIENRDLEPPFMCLVVSGGHTHLVKVVVRYSSTLSASTRTTSFSPSYETLRHAAFTPGVSFNTCKNSDTRPLHLSTSSMASPLHCFRLVSAWLPSQRPAITSAASFLFNFLASVSLPEAFRR